MAAKPSTPISKPTRASAARAASIRLLGRERQKARRSRIDRIEKTEKKSSVSNVNVCICPGASASPNLCQPKASSARASASIAMPMTTATRASGPMFQVSGACDGRTRSVASEILTKSVMNTSSTMPSAEMTNLPVTRNAMTTKPAFRTVLLTLLTIQVSTRW